MKLLVDRVSLKKTYFFIEINERECKYGGDNNLTMNSNICFICIFCLFDDFFYIYTRLLYMYEYKKVTTQIYYDGP